MPDYLPKGQIPEARGNEPATRLSILQSITKLSEQSMLEPFLVRQSDITYAGNVLSVAYGPGSIDFAAGFVAFNAGVATFNAPAAATSYDLVAKSDGTVILKAAGAGARVAGERILWRLTTGNPVADGTTAYADRRGTLGATDAITPGALPADAITATQIAPDAVGSSEIAPDAVGSSEIAAGAVGTSELADGALSADAAGRAKMVDGYLTDAKLADSGVAAASYGSASAVPVLTVNAKGRITAATTAAVAVGRANLDATVPGRSLPKLWAFGPAV